VPASDRISTVWLVVDDLSLALPIVAAYDNEAAATRHCRALGPRATVVAMQLQQAYPRQTDWYAITLIREGNHEVLVDSLDGEEPKRPWFRGRFISSGRGGRRDDRITTYVEARDYDDAVKKAQSERARLLPIWESVPITRVDHKRSMPRRKDGSCAGP